MLPRSFRHLNTSSIQVSQNQFVFRDRLILVLRLVKTFAHSIQCDQVIDRWMTFPSQKIWHVTYCYVDSPVRYVLPHDFSITPLFGSD